MRGFFVPSYHRAFLFSSGKHPWLDRLDIKTPIDWSLAITRGVIQSGQVKATVNHRLQRPLPPDRGNVVAVIVTFPVWKFYPRKPLPADGSP
jgi:hypothetical protein